MDTEQGSVTPGAGAGRALHLSALLVVLISLAVWFGAYRYFTAQELQRAEARMSLYHSTVLAELERFEHLTQVLAVDPFVIAGLAAADRAQLNLRLADFASAAGLDAIYLMRPDGETIAASNAGRTGSFVGQNYGFRPYFQTALSGGRGRFYGIGATTGLPGYFIADPVRDDSGAVIGVVALKLDLAPFEEAWRAAGEQVFLTDQHDVVLLASEPMWRYRVLDALNAAERSTIDQARQFPGQALDPLDWQADTGSPWARVDGANRLHVASENLPHSWRLHYLSGNDRAVTSAWLMSGAFVVFAALALLISQVRRGRQLDMALRRAEEEEAELRRTNHALAREIEERRRAERRLEETRGELERASRLAALGQLSASVTHELGQPIAAMRNQVTAHELKGGDSAFSRTIAGLIDRMEGITRQLKFFARNREDSFEDVDLRDCVDAVLDLMAPSFEAVSLRLDYTRPEAAVMARGARLRLEQVLTNLMRNAVDAMDDSDPPVLTLRFGSDADNIWIELVDNGHGLGEATLSDLREPFVTTRASGQGMGLGLAISSGIMEDHGGWLEARNRRAGPGAVFRIYLPIRATGEVAAE